MKKINCKSNFMKGNSVLTSLLSLLIVVAAVIPGPCAFWFYEPKKPEGMSKISLGDILQK